MAKPKLDELTQHQLAEEVLELKKKLEKKKSELTKTKSRLSSAQYKLQKLKATVRFQRERILELYRGSMADQP